MVQLSSSGGEERSIHGSMTLRLYSPTERMHGRRVSDVAIPYTIYMLKVEYHDF